MSTPAARGEALRQLIDALRFPSRSRASPIVHVRRRRRRRRCGALAEARGESSRRAPADLAAGSVDLGAVGGGGPRRCPCLPLPVRRWRPSRWLSRPPRPSPGTAGDALFVRARGHGRGQPRIRPPVQSSVSKTPDARRVGRPSRDTRMVRLVSDSPLLGVQNGCTPVVLDWRGCLPSSTTRSFSGTSDLMTLADRRAGRARATASPTSPIAARHRRRPGHQLCDASTTSQKFRTGDVAAALERRARRGACADSASIYESSRRAGGDDRRRLADPLGTDGAFDLGASRFQLDPEVQSVDRDGPRGARPDCDAEPEPGRAGSCRTVLEGERRPQPRYGGSSPTRRRAAASFDAWPLDASQRDGRLVRGDFGEPAHARPGAPRARGRPARCWRAIVAALAGAWASCARSPGVHAPSRQQRACGWSPPPTVGLAVVKAGKASGSDDLRGHAQSPAVSVHRQASRASRDPRRVVGATLPGLKAAWEPDAFDLVVMDEAAQVPVAYASLRHCPGHALRAGRRPPAVGPIVTGRHADEPRRDVAVRAPRVRLPATAPPRHLSHERRDPAATFPAACSTRGGSPRGRTWRAVDSHRFPAAVRRTLRCERHAGTCVGRSRGLARPHPCLQKSRVVAGIVLDRIVRQHGDPERDCRSSPLSARSFG